MNEIAHLVQKAVSFVYHGITFPRLTREFQGVAESSGRSKSAIFGRDEVSYENVKYSGRAAEGVRGNSKIYGGEAVANSGERSSSETPTNYVLQARRATGFLVLLPLRVLSTSQFTDAYGVLHKIDYPSISNIGKAVVVRTSEILSTIHPNYYLIALVSVWLISFVYIKIRYPFWNTQPVVHTYDYMRRFLTREAHIILKVPYKSRFHDKENKVSTTEYSRVSNHEKTQIAVFLQSHYIPTDRLLSTLSVTVLDAYLSDGASFISVFRENPPGGPVNPQFSGETQSRTKIKELRSQGVAESGGRSKSAIFGRDAVSYENPEDFTGSGPITGVITSRPIHVYLGPTHIEAYFTDFMCVHRESRRVAECLFQTHQFATFKEFENLRSTACAKDVANPQFSGETRNRLPISVFRKEGALCEGVVPFVSYTTYTYYMPKTSSQKKHSLPSGFMISRVGKHNITLVHDIYHLLRPTESENQTMFSTCILPDIGTMLGLLEKQELFLFCLKKSDQLYGIYIFRNAHIHYEELDGETLELIATIQNTANTPLFVSGFMEALREMIQGVAESTGRSKSAILGGNEVSYENHGFSGETKTRMKMLRIPSIGHNQVILSNFPGYLMETPTALYLYNYALPKMPMTRKCFVMV